MTSDFIVTMFWEFLIFFVILPLLVSFIPENKK